MLEYMRTLVSVKSFLLYLFLFSTFQAHSLPFLSFALGLQDAKELQEYKKWGFNSIWVDIYYNDSQMEKKEALIRLATKEDLIPIICLHLESPALGVCSP
ncbi:MAG: hypothetical protein ACPLSK_03360, partial [bacterium]